MNFWWVSQNQTFKHEVLGGFMWSPKVRADGGRNMHYEFMTHVQPGDIVFSFANRKIKAVGIALTGAYTATKPKDFGKAGDVWSDSGWKVDVDFRVVDAPIEPRNHMHLISPLLPEKYKPISSAGEGHQAYLSSISKELGNLLLSLLGIDELRMDTLNIRDLTFDSVEQEIIQSASMPETTKLTLVQARRGQGVFRERVKFVEKFCRVTGVDKPELLIASHIKPWVDSDNYERVNGHNGLFLSPHVDTLFDSGFISFENSGAMIVSDRLDPNVLDRWAIDASKRTKKFGPEQSHFLDFHRTKVLKP